MKVIILCGGKGTRLREETEFRPKPMVPIGDRPILWHIMKTYAHHGHKDFILCLGYKGEMIKEFFRNYLWNTCDATLRLGRSPAVRFHSHHGEEDWSVTLADTGENAKTATRIRAVEKYLGSDDTFLLTYGDGVGDIPIGSMIEHHRASGAVCTVAAVRPPGRFGELGIDAETGRVLAFNEKPQTEAGSINGGYMVCSREFFSYLPAGIDLMLEEDPMRNLAAEGKLSAFGHTGFWQPMDTFQEFRLLNALWESGEAPWKIW